MPFDLLVDFRKRQDNPLVKFAAGVVAFPFTVMVQTIIQEVGTNRGLFYDGDSRKWATISDFSSQTLPKFINRSVYPVGSQIVFGHFLQSYILNDLLSYGLKKVNREWEKWPESKEGKCLRVIAASFAYALCQHHRPGVDSVARICNNFVIALMANSLTMYFKSNIPGVLLYLLDQHTKPLYAS